MSAMLDIESEEVYGLPLKKYWTHDEYYHLQKIGILNEPSELINGEIVLKMPHNPPHIHIVFALIKWLRQIFGYDFVNENVPVALDNAQGNPSDPMPDAIVIDKAVLDFYPLRVRADNAVMVAEVSDSTLAYDRSTKAEVYAGGGIPEYWIIDVNARRIYIYRNPIAIGYSLIQIATEEDEISPLARPDAKIRVGDLFPPVENVRD